MDNLALDFKKQKFLMQKVRDINTAEGLLEDYDSVCGTTELLYHQGLIFRNEFDLLNELEAQVGILNKEKLNTLDDLNNRQEWENVRQLSRRILECMGLTKTPFSNREYTKYHYRKMIEAIRGLAMDYDVQSSFVPQQFIWAAARELIDNYNNEFHCRNQIRKYNFTSDIEMQKLEGLDKLIDVVVDTKLLELEHLEKRQEWQDIRRYARDLLEYMEMEIKPPVDITRVDILS